MLESKDIFRQVQLVTGMMIGRDDNCRLCGNNPLEAEVRMTCSACIHSMMDQSIKFKQEVYNHLLDLGDKERSRTFLKRFQVFKLDSPLKKIRKRLKLTQKAFAEKLGINRSQLAQIESGTRSVSKLIQHRLDKLLHE